MNVLKFDENHNSSMKQVFYLSGNNENVLDTQLKLSNEPGASISKGSLG